MANMLRLLRLQRDEKQTALFAEVMERVRTASVRIVGGDPAGFMDQLWTLWAQRSPLLGVWALLDANDELRGQLVATVQLWDGETVVWVHQAEADLGIGRDVWDQAYGEFGKFAVAASEALQKPIGRCLMVTKRPHAFERHGWQPQTTIMTRRIK